MNQGLYYWLIKGINFPYKGIIQVVDLFCIPNILHGWLTSGKVIPLLLKRGGDRRKGIDYDVMPLKCLFIVL